MSLFKPSRTDAAPTRTRKDRNGRRNPSEAARTGRSRLATAAAFALETLEARTLMAATPLYWDPAAAATATGGTGTWNTTAAQWRSGSATGSLVAWSNAGDANGPYQAVFPGSAGTVTIGVGVTASSVSFAASGYSLAGGNAITLAGGTGQVDVASGATATISAPLAGTVGLTKSSAGTLALTASNAYAGGTKIAAGTLNVTSDAALGAVPSSASTNVTFVGTAALQAGAAAVTLAATRGVSIAAGVTATLDTQANTLTVNGTVSNAASTGVLAKGGTAGTLVLAGSNSFAAGTTVNMGGGTNVGAGTLKLANSNALGTNAITVDAHSAQNNAVATLSLANGITVGSNVTYLVGGHQPGYNVDLESVGGANVFNGTFTLANSGGNYAVQSTSGTLTIGGQVNLGFTASSARQLIFQGAGAGVIAGVVTGNIAPTFSGPGTWTVSNVQTYTGATTVAGGTLSLNVNQSQYGTLYGTAAGGAITVNGGGTLLANNINAVAGYGDSRTSVVVNAGGALTNQTGYTNQLVNLTLAGGTLAVAPGSARYGGFEAPTGAVFSATATSAITGSGLTMDPGASFSVSAGATLSVSGALANTSLTTGVLTKNGPGTMALAGANNYGGATTVNAGTLQVDGTVGSGSVTIASGATLSGTGSVPGTVTVGGTLSPGDGAGTGILSTGALTFQPGSTLAAVLNGSTPGTGYDQVNVTGNASFGNATLALSGSRPHHAGDPLVLVRLTGSGQSSGGFTGLAQGGAVTIGGVAYQATYVSGSNGAGTGSSFSLVDGDPATATTLRATAQNVSAVRGIAGPYTVATFTDGSQGAGPYTASVVVGTAAPVSATVTLVGGTWLVKLPGPFAESGVLPVSVTVSSAASGLTTVMGTATVTNPQLTLTGGMSVSTSGYGLSSVIVATFADPAGPQPLSHYAGTIDYGDGTTGPAVISYDPSTGLSYVAANHLFTPSATTSYALTITLTEDGVASNPASVTGTVTIAPPTAPPPAPTNVVAQALSGTEGYVTWVDGSGEAAGYLVMRSENGSTPVDVSPLLPAGTTAFLDETLRTSTTYQYQIIGVNGVGNSAPSSSNVATTANVDTRAYYQVTSVGPVTPVQGGAGTLAGTIQLNFGGQFEAGSTMGAALQAIGGTLTVVGSGQSYTFGSSGAFRATQAGIEFDASYGLPGDSLQYGYQVSVTAVVSPQPLSPKNINTVPQSQSQVTISWQAQDGLADGYNVYRQGPDGVQRRLNPGATTTTTAGTTSFTDTDLSSNTAYSYYVTAVRHGTESQQTNTASAVTFIDPSTEDGRQAAMAAFADVYNSITVQLYAGAMKGPDLTRETGSGNDWDQALLLQKEIGSGAAVVYGRVTASIGALRGWLGLADGVSPNTVFGMLATAGLGPVSGDGDATITFNHAWVEVGMGPGQAPLELDPSWKQTEVLPGVAGVIPAVAAATIDPVQNPQFLSGSSTAFQYFEEQLSQWLATSQDGGSGKGVADVSTRGQIVRQPAATLPTALPLQIAGTPAPVPNDSSGLAVVPDTFAHHVFITVYWSGGSIQQELTLPSDSAKVVTVYTSSDGIVHLVTEDLIADATVGAANPIVSDQTAPLNGATGLTIKVQHYDPTDGSSSGNQNHIYAYERGTSDWTTFGVNAGQVSDQLIQGLQASMNLTANAKLPGTELPLISQNTLRRQALELAQLTYFRDLNEQRDLLAGQLGLMPIWSRVESGVTTGTNGPNGTLGNQIYYAEKLQNVVLPADMYMDEKNVGGGSVVDVDGDLDGVGDGDNGDSGYDGNPDGVGNGDAVVMVPTDPTMASEVDGGNFTELAEADEVIDTNASTLEGTTLSAVTDSSAMSTVKGFQWVAQNLPVNLTSPTQLIYPTDPAPTSANLGYNLTPGEAAALQAAHVAGYTLILPTIKVHIASGAAGADDAESASGSSGSYPAWDGLVWVQQRIVNHTWDRAFVMFREGGTSAEPSYPTYGGDALGDVSTVPALTPTPLSVQPSPTAGTGFNSYDGEALVDATDFTVPSVMPVSFSRHYGSTYDPAAPQARKGKLVDAGMGVGWSFSYSDFLDFQDVDGSLINSIIWVSGDGTRRTFERDPSGPGKYTSPAGDEGTLLAPDPQNHPFEFEYQAADGTVYTFFHADGQGVGHARLQSIEDLNYNLLTFGYSAAGGSSDADPLEELTSINVSNLDDGSGAHDLIDIAYYVQADLDQHVVGAALNHVKSVTSMGETWTYQYVTMTDPGDAAPATPQVYLSRVIAPATLSSTVVQGETTAETNTPTTSYNYFGEDAGNANLWGLLSTVTKTVVSSLDEEANATPVSTRTYSYYPNRRVFSIVDAASPGGPVLSAQYASYDLKAISTRTDDGDENPTVTTFTPDGHVESTRLADGTTTTQNWAGTDAVGLYMAATTPSLSGVGQFKTDANQDDQAFNAKTDGLINFGSAGDIPVVGDWTGDGKDKLGVYAGGAFYLDELGDNSYASATVYDFGTQVDGFAGPSDDGKDVPVIGDWNGRGKDEVGIFKIVGGGAYFYEDLNGDGNFQPGLDAVVNVGPVTLGSGSSQPSDQPVVGDWDGDGTTDVGIMSLVSTSNATRFVPHFDLFVVDPSAIAELHVETIASPSYSFYFIGDPGDQYDRVSATARPVSGYFSHDNKSDVGIYTDDGGQATFVLDSNGNHRRDDGNLYSGDYTFAFYANVSASAIPVVGNWDGNGLRDSLTSTTDSIGRTTQYRYDALGQVTDQIVNDGLGVNSSDNNGLETKNTYQVFQPRYGMLARFERLGSSTMLGRQGVGDQETEFAYDALGNRISSADYLNNVAVGDESQTSYDLYGRVASTTKPLAAANGDDATYSIYTTAYPTYVTGSAGQPTDLVGLEYLGTRDVGGTLTMASVYGEVGYSYDQYGNLSGTGDNTTSDTGVARATAYRYNSVGQLLSTSVADPSGTSLATLTTSTTYTYGVNGLVAASQNPVNEVSVEQYDGLGRLTSDTPFGGSAPKLTKYDAAGNVIETIDQDSNATFYYYDDRNRLVQIVYPESGGTAQELDAVGRTTGTLDATGARTAYAYDARDRVLQKKDPVGTVTTYAYDDQGMTTEADAGGTTFYAMDALGRVVQTLRPGSLLSTTSYDADGNVTSRATYDSASLGWTTGFPANDLPVIAGLLATAHVTTYTYDGLDRKLSETDPAVSPSPGAPAVPLVTAYTYDAAGNVVETAATSGDTTVSDMSTEFDSLNRAVGTGADGKIASVSVAGATVTVTLPDNGLQTGDLVLVRDAFGTSAEAGTPAPFDGVFAVTITGPDTFTYTYAGSSTPATGTAKVFLSATATAYDPVGNVYTQTDARGETTTSLYTGENWRSTEIAPNPAGSGRPQGPTTTWTYDAAGNIKSVTDALGNLPGANAALHTTTYTYDGMNRRTSTTLPDADGDLASPDAPRTVTSYTATGQLESTTDPLGNASFTVYDGLGRAVLDAGGGEWGTVANVSGTAVLIYLPGHGLSSAVQTVAIGAGPGWLVGGAYRVTVDDPDTITITLSVAPDAIAASLSAGQPVAVSQFYTTTQYDAQGRIEAATDRNRVSTTYQYDVAGNVQSTTVGDADGSAATQGDGSRTTYLYDSFGNVQTTTSPDGYESGNDPANFTTTYTYDALDRKVSQTVPAADTFGDPGVILYQYDPLDRLTSTDASGVVALTSYDALGRATMSAAGGRGNAVLTGSVPASASTFTVTVTLHDHGLATGDRVFVRGADNEYLGVQTITVVDADTFTFVASSALAAAGEFAVVSATSAETAYDADGNVISTTDGRGNTTTDQYDELNRKVVELQPSPDGVQAAPETSYAYDFDGNLIAMQSPDGNAASGGEPVQSLYLTTYGYDDENRKISQSTPAVGTAGGLTHPVTNYSYDLAGNLATVTDPRGAETIYGYDRLNRKVREQDPHAGGDATVDDDPVTTWAYDGNGNVLSETSPLGNQPGANAAAYTTNYAYTNLNKVLVKVLPDPDGSGSTAPGAQVITRYTYDADGNLLSMTDPLGNLPGANAAGHTTNYAYDALNRVIATVQPDPDGSGQLGATVQPITRSTYDVFGNQTSATDALGRTTATVHDSLHRPIFTGSDVQTGTASSSTTSVTVDVTNSAIAVNDYVLAFGPAGSADPICGIYLVTGVSGSSVTFSVPDLTVAVTNEPISLGRSPSATTYDANGNVTSTSDALGQQTTYQYDALNRKVKQSLPDPDPTNDPAGTAAPVTTYQYDASGRLIATIDPIGNQSTDSGVQALHRTGYVYDPAGDKVNEIDGANLTVAGDGTVTLSQATPDSPITGYGYDLDGNVYSIEKFSASGPEFTNYAYDCLNRKVAQTLPSASTGLPGGADAAQTLYTYDVAGNLLTAVDPRGNVAGAAAANFTTTYRYDALNRKSIVSVADADAAGDAAITTYQYDHNGNLLTTVDPLGNLPGGNATAHTTSYQYDALNRKTAEIDPPANLGDANQPTTRWGYDLVGNTVWMIDPLGNQGLGISPAASILSALVATHHNATTYVYDDLNRKVAEVDPHASDTPADDSDVPVTTFGYNAAGEMVWTTSPGGNQLDGLNPYVPGTTHTTYYQYDRLGQKVSESAPNPDIADGPQQPSVTRYGYDVSGKLIYTIDPLANVVPDASPSPSAFAAINNAVANHLYTTVTVYDNLNRKMSDYQADADGNPATTGDRPVTSYTYDQLGNVLTQTDPAGNVTTNVYYLDNTLHTETTLATVNASVTNVVRTYTYDVDGDVHTELDRDGHGSTYTYDPLNRVTNEVQTATGLAPEVTFSAYDVAGRLTSTSDNSSSYVYKYDSLGRVVETDSQTTAMTGRLPLGPNVTPAILTPTLSYFNNGQDVPAGDYVITYVSGTLQFGPAQGYDIIDRDANGYHVSFGGGTVAFPATYIDGATTAQSEAANAGRSITVHHTGGKIGVYIQDSPYFDNVAGSDGAPTFKLTAASGLTAGAAPVVYTYAYDVAGRKESATAKVYGATDHTEVYHFDDLDRNDGVTQVAAGTPNLTLASTYDTEGHLKTEQRYSGSTPVIHSAYLYDDAGRLYSLIHTNGGPSGGSTIDAYSFAFDLEGWVVQFQSSADGTATYAYDGNGQLTGSTGSAAAAGSEQYVYDANGNRKTATSAPGQSSGGTQTYATGKDNRVTAAGSDTFAYDAEGNRTGETVTGTAAQNDQLGYDSRNRLLSDAMTTTAGTLAGQLVSAAYQYDVDDRRVGKTVSTTSHPAASGTPDSIVSERYAYDGDQLSMILTPGAPGTAAATASPPQAVVSTRVFGTPGSTTAAIATVNTTTGAITWLLGDNQGSVRDTVTNGATTHVKYDAYGNVISAPTATPLPRFGYTGQVYDAETGLTYMNARYYDPGTGGFVSQDPTGFSAGDANLYRYVGNSTPNGTDPTGEAMFRQPDATALEDGLWGRQIVQDSRSMAARERARLAVKRAEEELAAQQEAGLEDIVVNGADLTNLFIQQGGGVALDPFNQGGFAPTANGIGQIYAGGDNQPDPTTGLSPGPYAQQLDTDPYAPPQIYLGDITNGFSQAAALEARINRGVQSAMQSASLADELFAAQLAQLTAPTQSGNPIQTPDPLLLINPENGFDSDNNSLIDPGPMVSLSGQPAGSLPTAPDPAVATAVAHAIASGEAIGTSAATSALQSFAVMPSVPVHLPMPPTTKIESDIWKETEDAVANESWIYKHTLAWSDHELEMSSVFEGKVNYYKSSGYDVIKYWDSTTGDGPRSKPAMSYFEAAFPSLAMGMGADNVPLGYANFVDNMVNPLIKPAAIIALTPALSFVPGEIGAELGSIVANGLLDAGYSSTFSGLAGTVTAGTSGAALTDSMFQLSMGQGFSFRQLGISTAIGGGLGLTGFGMSQAFGRMGSGAGVDSSLISGISRDTGSTGYIPLSDSQAAPSISQIKMPLYSYYDGAFDAGRGSFTASSGRVYMTSNAPGPWLQDEGFAAGVTRFVRTGRFSPYDNPGYFTTGATDPAEFGLSPIFPRTANFWKSFGGQFQTRIGISGFEIMPGQSTLILPQGIPSTSRQVFQSALGFSGETTADVTAGVLIGGSGYLIYAKSK